MLRQDNIANLGFGLAVDGRIQQNSCAVGECGMHGTAVHPAALPAWQQHF